jgi:hypothetical protein
MMYALWCEEGKCQEGMQERSTCQLLTYAPGEAATREQGHTVRQEAG